MRRRAALLVLSLGGCTIARMDGFDAIATAGAEQFDVTGIPGWKDGDFRLGASRGHVRRVAGSDQRGRTQGGAGIVDLERSGRLRFDVTGPEVGGTLDGDCLYERRQRRERSGPVSSSFSTRPLTLACSYHFDGRPIGVLDLSALPGSTGVAEPRIGRLRIDGVDLALVSTHRAAGLSMPLDLPIGYRIEDAAGTTIGAVETSGLGTRRLALPRDAAHRRPALAAALTLALFWDPGDTD